jgi:predicted PurR-regulated permease PerM
MVPETATLRSRLVKATVLLAFVAVGVILYFAQDAFIPVAVALFLALLLTPAVDRLQRWHVPRGLAVTIVMLGVLLAGAGAVNAVWNPAKDWLARAPQTLRTIDARVRPLRAVFAQVDAVTERAGRLTGGSAQSTPTGGGAVAAAETGKAMSMTKSVLEGLTVIPLMLFFLLGGPPLLARMVASLSGKETTAKSLRLMEAIRVEVGRYFATVALINVGLGAATAAAVAALGMPNPILWGTIAGVFNFIPYLGPITTIVILGGAALVTFDDLGHALAVPGAFIVLHLIEGQVVQPLTVGRRLEVNALVILLAVWFGFWFWGIPGVLLAVPLLVALKVAAEHQPSWQAVRNFLAPNEGWQPKTLDRLLRAGDLRAMRSGVPTAPATAQQVSEKTVRPLSDKAD